jgi:uncharacterized protein
MMLEPKLGKGKVEIDLRGLLEGTVPFSIEGEAESLPVDPDSGATLRDFRVQGVLALESDERQVRGSVSGVLATTCDRCLADLELKVEAELDSSIVLAGVAAGEGAGAVVRAEKLSNGAVRLDLTEPLQEAILLELPIKNLCRADCLGICSICGANRNVEPCACKTTPRDPRWDALKDLSVSKDPEE